jgi:hypothetical protein
MLIDLLFSIVATVLSTSVVITMQAFSSRKTNKRDAEEVKNAVDSTMERIQDSDTVIELMIKNVAELREYYIISKQQANKSFSSALFICFLGFVVFLSGILISYFSDQNIIVFTTISGSIVEIVSGLFFWLYKNSISQLNIYHERLGTTEKCLTAIQLIEKMSQEKRDEGYRFLMESILVDNSSIVRAKKTDTGE